MPDRCIKRKDMKQTVKVLYIRQAEGMSTSNDKIRGGGYGKR